MGSCENLTSVDEPSCNSVFEQHSSLEFMEEPVSEQRMCLKTRFDVLDANVSGSTKLDGRLGLSSDDTTHCVSCGDAGDTGIGNKDGLIDEFQNVVGVSSEKAIDDECGVSRVCFIESQEEIGVCSSPDRCLDLSQDGNNIYVSSAYVTEAVVGDRDGSVSKCDNVSGSGLEKLVDESQSKVDSEAVVGDRDGPASECDNVSGSVLEKLVDEEQGVCLDGSQSEVDVCGFGLCVEKGGFQGEDLESFKHQKLPLGEVPSNCSPRNCERQDKQKDDQGFNRSSVEETVEVMGVETNALAEVKLGNDNQTLSSDAYEMPLKSIPVGGLTRNCVQQHGQKGDNILSCLPGEEGVVIKKSDELAELEKVPCDLIMPFGSFGIPLTGSPRNCVQHGDQKDGRTVSCSSSEGDMEGKEVKTDALDGIEKVNCFQISPSQFCEMPPELLPFTGSPNNSVQQEDQENDNTVGCTSSEGDMECIEEKTDALSGKMKVTCDQMLPSQCCEMDSEAISLIDSPTDCVQLGNQENNKNGGSLSSKSAKEVIEDKMRTCGQIFPSQGCSMTPELIPKTDSLRNCTQQNEQKSNECICVPSLEEEGKNYASVGIEIDICGHTLSFQECEIRSESTLVTEKQLIVEAKRDIVHGLENDSGHPRSPLEHTEPRMEFASATDLSFSCIQKKEQQGIESLAEGKANLSAAVEANMWKANLAVAVEANMCNCISASQDGETPFKVSYEDDLMRTCEGHKDHVDHESIGHLAVGTVEQKDNTDTCILALPMQSCQSSLESLRVADSLSNCSQQNDQGNNKSVDGLSAESATEAVEEKSDVTTDIKVEICSQLSPIEENEKEHSSRVIEKPISLQSCQPSAVDENGSCKSLNVAGLSQKDGFGAISSSGAVDGFGQIDHEVKDDVGTNCFSETKYPNRVSLSSRRSSRISRSSQKTQTKRAARNCRTKAKIQHSHGSIDIILNIARRKRSCLSKPARSSIWGLLGSITQIFGKSGMSSFNLSQNQGSQKARGDHRSQKRNKIQASGSSSTPSKKCNVSTRCLRLKVKVGKEICQSTLNVVVPKVADTMGSNDIVVGDDISESYPTKNSKFPILAHEEEDIFGEEGTQRQFQCLDSNPEEVVKHPGDSILDVHFASQELKATVITDNAAGDVADGNSAHKGVEVLGGASENNYVDPGTSPDSEVINTAPDSEVGTRSKEGLHKVVLTSSEIFAAPGNVTSSRRGKKKTNLLFAGNCSLHDDSPVAASKVKPPKKRGGRQKLEDGSHSSDSLVAFPVTYASSNSSSGKEFCGELLPSSRDSEPGIIEEAMVPSVKCKGSELSKSLKSGGRKKGRSKVSNSAKSRRRKASTQRGNQRKSVNKNAVKEKGVLAAKRRDEGVLEPVEEKTEVRPQIDDIGKTDSGNNSMSVDVSNAEITSGGEPEHYCPPESAWVRCDDCYKWRRIPVSVADSIDENCRWVCKDNMDTTFADCSIPQEKTNADINAELGLSDYEEEDGLINYNRSGKGLDFQSTPGSSFRRIDSNVFLHRSRKTQTIDEVMVCHCKPPLDGRLGCRDECLNRMLNIECVQGTCPCGDLCSNQQFQKRKYAKMQWRPCGKKGYGLESLEDIPTGEFIIEYVGEVLDMQAYEARQKEYAANGHKHFYFMTLNGSEVIDACAKGNLGRFINHSCDPNCRTEKWMVNGEICIGLFAMRDIKGGEELTFDYNYVRVFGAAAKKCHCGSPQCRGYIGGDPLNTEIIYQGDSDEEYPEPLMLEDGETGDGFKTMSRTSPFYGDRAQISEAIAEDTNKMDNSARAVRQLEISGNVNDSKSQSIPAIPQLHHSLEREDSKGKWPPLQSIETSLVVANESSIPVSSVQQKETMNKTSSVIPQVETSLPALISGNLFTDGSDAGRKSKSDIVEDNQSLPKSHPRIKTSRKSGSIKKGKVDGSPLGGNKVKSIASKSQVFFIKPKKIMEGSSNGRFEAVQEKLNELLDAEGGISKRKDAPKGYLKLLLLTAASGGSGNGESIQSNRDLSMILDALLKTKSRVVLMDIINKNGLQMLHNMIKQYRRDFKKIPILRKLLKVLEYLAVREILTRNHITAGPPCPGMESFRGSILSLTEHEDKQVHQIARSFRDRWIPKPFRKHSYKDRDDSGMEIHKVTNCNRLPMLHNHRHDESLRPSEAIDCVMQSLVAKTSVDTAANEAGSSPGAGGCQTNGPKVRKRKSRWDQPAETNLDSIKHKKLMLESRVLQIREDINCPDHIHNHCNKDEAVSSEDGGQITQEDVPPGFSSPFNPPLVSSDSSSTTDLSQQNVSQLRCAFDVAIAHPQGKFNSRLPVSYGIPLHILQQFGSSQAETVDSWVIAPGMPFHPFPPLPPIPRDKKDTPPASAVSCKTIDGPAEEWQQDSYHAPRCYPDEDNPSMTGANQSDADIPGTDAQHTCKRMRGSSNDLGKRYFRQQKRKGPPWLWRRNELRSSYCSQDVSCRVDKPVSSFIQRPPQQNHH